MKKFLQRYKVLMVVVFSFCFFIFSTGPVLGLGEAICLYYKGSGISENCIYFENNKKVKCIDGYGSGIKNKNGDEDETKWMYPDNLVGAHQTTIGRNCFVVPGYYTVPDNYYEDHISEAFFKKGEILLFTEEGKLFKKTLIKNQLNLNIKASCCVSRENNQDKLCGQPKIKYSDEEMSNLDITNFFKKKLYANDMYIIDNGRSEFWKHVYCGVSPSDLADRYEHWNISCTNPIPNEKDREKLKHIPASTYGHFNTNSSLIDSYLYCKHPLDSTKYCACLKTNNNKCFRDGSTWKTEEACNLFLEKNDNKKEYECIVCPPAKKPPAKKPPAEKKVEKLEAPSTLGDLNKMGNVDIPVLIGKGIKLLMQVIGTIALLMFVYGGLLWMVSAGNTEKTKKAMDIMLWAGLGVIVILSSYAIVNFVFSLVK
jgi:hypothetical protein